MEPGSSSHQLQGVQTDHRQWGPLAKRQPLLPKMPGQTAAGACHSATGCGWAPAASAGGRLSKPKPSPWELPRAAVQRGQPSPPRSSSGCSSASFSAPRRAPASSSAWCQERQQGLPLRVGGGSTDGPALTCHCPAGPWLRLSSRPSGGLYLPGSCGQGCLQEQNPPPSGLFLGPLQRGLALGTADTSSCPVSPGPGPQGRPSSRTVCDGAAGLPAQEEGDPPGSARVLGNSKTTCPPTWDACAHIPQAAAPRAYLEVRGPPQQPARSRTVSR